LKLLPAALALLACVASACARGEAHEPAALFSRASYEEAEAEARASGRLLLVDVTASWCPPCQMMERETWPDERVAEWVERNAVAVQVDVDRRGDLAQQFGVRGVPTLVVRRDGTELGRTSGGLGPDELLGWLEGFGAR
jgi:thiol:disulfide interchange protein